VGYSGVGCRSTERLNNGDVVSAFVVFGVHEPYYSDDDGHDVDKPTIQHFFTRASVEKFIKERCDKIMLEWYIDYQVESSVDQWVDTNGPDIGYYGGHDKQIPGRPNINDLGPGATGNKILQKIHLANLEAWRASDAYQNAKKEHTIREAARREQLTRLHVYREQVKKDLTECTKYENIPQEYIEQKKDSLPNYLISEYSVL
jgi:hypothetical protein